MFKKKFLKNKSGMTFIEMIVAIAVFLVVVLISSQIFVSIISGQRRSIAQQSTQENMRYLYETMGKEIRQAQRSDTECYALATNRIYNTNTNGTILYFRNKNKECVMYALVGDTLVVRRGTRVASTTPEYLKISGLSFNIIDNLISIGPSPVQPRVTFKMRSEMDSEAFGEINLNMQTTVSSRYYE